MSVPGPLIAVVVLALLSSIAIWCRPLVRLYLLEPVAGGVPVLTAILIVMTPQMADMMVATAGGRGLQGGYDESIWHQFGFGLASPLLGFQGWFWMRAALNARAGDRDMRSSSTKSWAEALAPRLILFPALLIGLSPLVAVLGGRMAFGHVPWLAIVTANLGMGLLFLFIWRRQRILPPRRGFAALPRWQTARLITAAPIHSGVAWVSLLLGLGGFAAPLLAPNLVNAHLHTASAALLAMACLVPVACMVLALLRDGLDCIFRQGMRAVTSTHTGFAASDVIGVMLLLALPALGSWIAETAGGYDVPRGGALRARPTVDEAVNAWAGCGVPVVVVLEGGASRSAAWSLSVMAGLDAATDGRFGKQIFAISSVSGGSLGAVTYAMLRKRADQAGTAAWPYPSPHVDNPAQHGLVELARADLLSSAVVSMLTTDALTGVPTRGPTLAAAFEHFWQSKTGFRLGQPAEGQPQFQSLRSAAKCAPHLLLNGTDTRTGSRVITSTLDIAGSADVFADSFDALGVTNADFSAANAVLNSARFPIISPPGIIGSATDKTLSASVADGGIFEALGARTAAEIIRVLDRRGLNPIVVIIRNDGDEHGGAAPPCASLGLPSGSGDAEPGAAATTRGFWMPEFMTSLLGMNAARGAHARVELAALRTQFCAKDAGKNSFFDFDLPIAKKTKGNSGVPMNWVLDADNCAILLGTARTTPYNARQAGGLALRLATPGYDPQFGPDQASEIAAKRINGRGDAVLCKPADATPPI